MAKYMVQANYAGDGLRGLLKDGGSGRHAVLDKAVKALGGTIESMYYAIGEYDLFIILDMPDNVAVTALLLAVRAASPFTIKTSVLLSLEEMDAVAKKSPTYRGPGQ